MRSINGIALNVAKSEIFPRNWAALKCHETLNTFCFEMFTYMSRFHIVKTTIALIISIIKGKVPCLNKKTSKK